MPPPIPVFISSYAYVSLGRSGLLEAPSKPLSSKEIVGGEGEVMCESVKLRDEKELINIK